MTSATRVQTPDNKRQNGEFRGLLRGQGFRNIQTLLLQRECGLRQFAHGGGAVARQERLFYRAVVPSTTLAEIDFPSSLYIRKFSPDGQLLICFARTHDRVLAFRYCGAPPVSSTDGDDDSLPDQAFRFETYFKNMFDLRVTTDPREMLFRDFCLFTENGFLLVASSMKSAPTRAAPPDPHASALEMPTYDVTFHLLSLSEGKVVDQLRFPNDFIALARHSGVSLLGPRLGILSVRHQTIHMYWVADEGRFVRVSRIGAHCRDDDELVLATQQYAEQRTLIAAAGRPMHSDDVEGRRAQEDVRSRPIARPDPSLITSLHAPSHETIRVLWAARPGSGAPPSTTEASRDRPTGLGLLGAPCRVPFRAAWSSSRCCFRIPAFTRPINGATAEPQTCDRRGHATPVAAHRAHPDLSRGS
ncbi:putative light-mediated development protein DET1 [Paratrimastix pyriformis]|uniref:Light-mediated development protein DET1 n=1 Tax=Paratrimastix pyriformis TaxID=342808 RepID=A0ABQ8UQB1_9EUKA|nr:putative light-mediated development protein DET1 [Paratrimastix pyriformis]